MDTSADQLRNRAVALVSDWVATLFRPYPSAADIDRLVESLVAVVTAAVAGADARVEAVVAAVEATARHLHGGTHEGPFAECPDPPCGPIRDALAKAV